MSTQAIILTGPTASGKSAAALDLASRINGEIINADSMQVYKWLPLLTAQPTVQEQHNIKHHLYGVLTTETGSLGWWYEQACLSIDDVLKRQRVPIIVGGTGLYLRALAQGISAIPEIPPIIRQQARELAGQEDFYNLVMAVDPLTAQSLHRNDKQRLIRAYEVMLATGKSIRDWQQHNEKRSTYSLAKIALIPERDELYKRIDARFEAMIAEGALKEVEGFLKQDVPGNSPIQRAVGLPELKSVIVGKIPREVGITLAQQASRQYAKRQLTWLRQQGKEYQVINNPTRLTQLIKI